MHAVKTGEAFTTTEIGLHQIQSGSQSLTLAVNLAPEEGRVLPLEPAKLTEYGLKLSAAAETDHASATSDQRLTSSDTEQRQHLWWWFLIALLAVLLLETMVAGRTRSAAAA
jgi:hypothetical protein